jgi:acetyltransferase
MILSPDGAVPEMSIPFPVVAKVLSRDIPHKSDVGGVCIGIAAAAELAAAAKQIIANARRLAPQAPIEGVLACEMVSGGVEMLVGVVNDPGFGPVVALGLGGVFTEVLNDVAHRVAPFGPREAREMISELKGRKILDGVRGRARCDTEALAEAVSRISLVAWKLRERIVELDVNPLIVRPAGEGVIAADAMLILR